MIYILTGKVHSGKSSALNAWISSRKNVGGFLSPDIGSKRFLIDIHNDKKIPFQVDESFEGEVIEVGPYIFRKDAFAQAATWTIKQLNEELIEWVIVDELGKLELKRKGFYGLAKTIVESQNDKNILFVIRDFLVDDLVQLFGFEKAKVISISDLPRI